MPSPGMTQTSASASVFTMDPPFTPPPFPPPFTTPFTPSSSSPPPSPASISSSSCSSSFSSVPYSPCSSSSSSSSSTVSEEDGYEYEDGSARDGGGWAVPQPVRGWGAGAGAERGDRGGGVGEGEGGEGSSSRVIPWGGGEEAGFRLEADDDDNSAALNGSDEEQEEETKEEHQDSESLDGRPAVELFEEIVSPSPFSSSSSSASSSSSSWSSLSSNSIRHTGNLNSNSTGPGASESLRVVQRTRRQGMCPPPLMFGGRGPVLGAPGYGYFGSGGSGELPTTSGSEGIGFGGAAISALDMDEDELDEKKKNADDNQTRNMNGNRSKSATRSRKEEEFEKELLETVLALENSFMEPVGRAAASSSSFLDGSQNLSCFAVSLKSLAASSGSSSSGGSISRTPSPMDPPPGLPLPPVPTTGLPLRPSLKRRPSAFIVSQAAGTSPNEGLGVGVEVPDLPSKTVPAAMSASTPVSLPAQPSHSTGIPNANTNTNTRRSGASHAPLRPSQLRKTSLGASSTMKTRGVPPVPSLPLPPLPLLAVPSTSTTMMTTAVASEGGNSSQGRECPNGGGSESLVPTKIAPPMVGTKTKTSVSAPNPSANDPSNNNSASEPKSGILKVKPPVTGTSGTGTANSNSGGQKPFLPGDVRPMSASTRKKLQEFEVGPRLLNERARRSKGVGLGLTNVGGLFPVSLAPASAASISEISTGGQQRQRLDVKLTKEHIMLRRKMQGERERVRVGVGFGQRF